MSLVARHLEANGIPTVVIATARDIVESAAVPRLLFVDFPLGAPCGEPWNLLQQRAVLEKAFRLLETATAPRTTVDAGLIWSKGQRWKDLIFTGAALSARRSGRGVAEEERGLPATEDRRKGLGMARTIIVYTTPLCAPCEALKRSLEARGLAFETVDLLMDEAAAERLEDHGIRSAPALEIDGRLYAGAKLADGQLDAVLKIQRQSQPGGGS